MFVSQSSASSKVFVKNTKKTTKSNSKPVTIKVNQHSN